MIAGMEPAGSPVTVQDEDFSSLDAPRRTGDPSISKDMERQLYNIAKCNCSLLSSNLICQVIYCSYLLHI